MAPVLIVGAGPTGLVLALSLVRHGVAIRIVDKGSGPGLASRAIVVHARTLEFYQQLGFAAEVVGLGIKVETVHLREGGEDVARLTLKDMGEGLSPFPFMLGFAQDDHERFLVGKLKEAGVEIEWNVALASFTQDAAGVRAVLDKAGTAETCEIAYLCGCDGARSRVREVLGLGFPGGTYDHLFYVADVKLRGEPSTDAYVNLNANAFALMLPVRSRGMQRLIGIVPDGVAGHDHLTSSNVR